MDKIHDPESRAWISPKIEMQPYFEQLSRRVAELKPVKDTRDVSSKTLMSMMGMEDKELFSQLEEVMKVDHLTCEEEVEAMQISDPIQENIHGPDIPRFYKTNITPTGMTETSISYREPETLHQRKAEAEDSLPTGRVVGENEG